MGGITKLCGMLIKNTTCTIVFNCSQLPCNGAGPLYYMSAREIKSQLERYRSIDFR